MLACNLSSWGPAGLTCCTRTACSMHALPATAHLCVYLNGYMFDFSSGRWDTLPHTQGATLLVQNACYILLHPLCCNGLRLARHSQRYRGRGTGQSSPPRNITKAPKHTVPLPTGRRRCGT